MTLEEREWRFGPRGGAGHRPMPNLQGVCIALGPDGRVCGRACNYYQPLGGTARWRHNPRPYGRAGKTRRRRIGR